MFIKQIYNFILTIPDRLYLIPSEINGKKEYFLASYNHTKKICQEFAGSGYCREILIWRELFHFLGAIFFIFLSIGLEKIFKTSFAGLIVLGMVVVWITFQEFYLHPTFYSQSFSKGIIDFLVWVVPIALYLFLKK